MGYRIKNVDTDTKFGAMIDYFNSIQDSSFVRMINTLANNCGYSTEYHHCSLASARHPLEEVEFEGDVRFIDATGTSGEQSVVVDYATFYKYLQIACEDYLNNHSQDKSKINECLKTIRDRYNIEL